MPTSIKERLLGLTAPREDFSPPILRLQRETPSPLPLLVLRAVLGLLVVLLVWATVGKLDIVAVAPGKLVPISFLQVVQPSEAGIVREILVREGDEVGEGQALVRMDAKITEADRRTLHNDLAMRRLQIRRIDAELAGRPPARDRNDPSPLFVEVASQYASRRKAYLDALSAEQAALAKAEQDYRAAGQQEAKLVRVLPLVSAQDAGWQQLVKEGFAGKLMALDKARAKVEVEQELAVQRHAVESLKASLDQARQRVAQTTSTYRSQLMNERVDAAVQLHKLEQEWDKLSHRHALLELRAPQAGVIKDLATHTRGTVVQPGTILMTLVPLNEPMQVEVSVANLDAGQVREGQAVKIKLAPYPFQKYGMVEGRVIHISPDASEPIAVAEQRKAAANDTRQQAGYRTLVALKTPYLEAEGQRHRLVPGMQVAAEIHLGTRTVLEYLLSPVRKIAQEAGREH